jgi:glyoxylase-like metal-dependent hydrolase (beta-lactamase superfamily II)
MFGSRFVTARRRRSYEHRALRSRRSFRDVDTDVSRRTLLRRLVGGGVAAAIGTGVLRPGPGAAPAAAAPASTAPRAAHRFRLGDLSLRVLDDGAFGIPFDWLAANARPRALADAAAAGDLPTDVVPLQINTLLVETGGQLVLIDTGYGAVSPNPDGGKLPLALQAEGIAPEEIDLVLLTHLHFDHVGGALDVAGKPAFANARYLVNRAEHEFWLSSPSLVELPIPDDTKQFVRQVAKDTAAALKDKIEQVDPGDEVAPGVTVVAAPGHTPGHVGVEVASGASGCCTSPTRRACRSSTWTTPPGSRRWSSGRRSRSRPGTSCSTGPPRITCWSRPTTSPSPALAT